MAEASTDHKPPLDELMLAMDVVDTLRHRDLLVDRELQSDERDQKLLERLRQVYQSQGIEVSDQVLEEGVKALKEDRFVYQPTDRGFSSSLARAYVSRGSWGKPVLVVAGFALVLWLGYSMLVRWPAERHLAALPAELERLHGAVTELAEEPEVDTRADVLLSQARNALAREEVEDAEQSLADLEILREALDQEYKIQVVSRPDEYSGVWRVPDSNPDARNYYVIVEAVSANDEILTVPVVNEEDGVTRKVDKWGLRVSEAVFEAMARDKQDDGILQNRDFGVKRRGYLAPEYRMPTTGDAITSW